MASRSTSSPTDAVSRGRIEAAFAELEEHPRFAWTSRRRSRRLLVIAQATLLVIALVLYAQEQLLAALLAFLPFFPLMSLVNVSIHGMLDIPATRLDPVMVRLRTEAKARAHGLLVWLLGVLAVVLLGLAVLQVGDDGVVQAPLTAVASGAAGVLLLTGLLPRWLLAWQLPEPDGQDQPSA